VSAHGYRHNRRRSDGFGLHGVLLGLVLLSAAAGVAWVYTGMVTLERWPIRWLDIDGAFERVSAEQVRKRAAPLVEGSYFTVDMQELQQAVGELAWVSRVAVQKTWPDAVQLRVEEYVPVAHWIDGQLIANNGSAFTVPGAAEIQGLPWLEGPPGTVEEVIGKWQAFNNMLQPVGLEIDLIRLDRRGAWYLRLTSGTEIHLGRQDAGERLARLVSSWPALRQMDQRTPLGVDLRYSNGFAVRWAPPAPEMASNSG
jgi:cell division protein FtsQ